jgi:hypothetical protein
MSAEENERLIRHFFDALNARDMGAFEVSASGRSSDWAEVGSDPGLRPAAINADPRLSPHR